MSALGFDINGSFSFMEKTHVVEKLIEGIALTFSAVSAWGSCSGVVGAVEAGGLVRAGFSFDLSDLASSSA